MHLQNTFICPPKSDEIRVVKVLKSSFSQPAIHVVYAIYFYGVKFSLNKKDPFSTDYYFPESELDGEGLCFKSVNQGKG